MAIVERKYGATITRGADLSDNLRDVAPDLWPEVIAEYRLFCQRSLPTDCRNLLRMVAEGEHAQWAGYGGREAYLREGLGIEPDAADWALHGLEIAGVEAPIGYQQAQQLGKHGGARPGAGRKFKNKTKDYNQVDLIVIYPKVTRPLAGLRLWWRRASPEDRAVFLAELRNDP